MHVKISKKDPGSDGILVGANLKVEIDGKIFPHLHRVQFDCSAGQLAQIHLSSYLTGLEIEGDVGNGQLKLLASVIGRYSRNPTPIPPDAALVFSTGRAIQISLIESMITAPAGTRFTCLGPNEQGDYVFRRDDPLDHIPAVIATDGDRS